MTTINRQRDLDQVLKQIDITIDATAHAQIALIDERPDAAQKKIQDANTHAQRAGLLLREMGAQGVTAPTSSSDFDLGALDNLDTPDARKLLEGLEGLLATAERVDRSRGNWLENAPHDDTQGTHHADSIMGIIRQLRGEIFGA